MSLKRLELLVSESFTQVVENFLGNNRDGSIRKMIDDLLLANHKMAPDIITYTQLQSFSFRLFLRKIYFGYLKIAMY